MIHLLTALRCEAKPLIAHFRLRGVSAARGFSVYARDDVQLIVSGIGKSAAAAAVGYLQAFAGNDNDAAWLNAGVAGHASHPVGEGFLAGRIRDQASGRSHYPVPIVDFGCRTAEVLSVDRVEATYAGDSLYEMEASGFFATACRFSTAELVHCYKIVSDTLQAPTAELTESKVSALIEMQLKTIDLLAAKLSALASEVAGNNSVPHELERFLTRWHFSATQQRQLARLLVRLRALDAAYEVDIDALPAARDGAAVLSALQGQLASRPVRLAGGE